MTSHHGQQFNWLESREIFMVLEMALKQFLSLAACIYFISCFTTLPSKAAAFPLHASCKIDWHWDVNCTAVNTAIVSQIKKWHSADNCDQGGEKCLYSLVSSSSDEVKATHETPKKHYVDDLTFTFKPSGDNACDVHGYSRSETWYAVLDYGTNYCNLHNLITGAGLDKMPGYSESTSNSVCTEYTSAKCDKY